MTLLTITEQIADYTNGARPTSIANNTNPDAQKLLRVVNKVGRKIAIIYTWNILRKEHSFNAPGVETLLAAAAFPSDFHRFVPETFWDRGLNNLLSGPVSPVEWSSLKTYNPRIQNTKWIYRGGDVLSNPIVEANSECAFEYMTDNYVLDNTSTPKNSFTADDDTTLLDEELIALAGTWEWLASEGQPYAQAEKDFKDYFNMVVSNEDATADILVTGDIFARNARHDDGAPSASRTQYFGTL